MLNFALDIRQKIGHWLNGLKGSANTLSGGFKGPLSDKKKVLILSNIETEEDRNALSSVKKGFCEICPKAEVSIACFYEKGKKDLADNFISDKEVKYFSEESFGFFFGLKDAELIPFVSSGYDIAVLIPNSDKIPATFLSHYVVADLRIGWACEILDQEGMLNFCVTKGDTPAQSVKNIFEAIKMIFS